MDGPRQFRQLLKNPGIIRSLGAHDVFTARLIEDAGLETAFIGGFGTSASLFIEAPQSRAELDTIPRRVRYPLLVNMLSGGVTPILSSQDLQQLGYKIVVCPIESLLITGAAVKRLISVLLNNGKVDSLSGEMMTFAQIKKLLGLDEVLSLREKFENR